MELIGSGEQLEGIESLQKAQELMPHPSVLYNIGLAFSDLGLTRSAIDYLRRYVANDPPDAATVRRLVVGLEQQLGSESRPESARGGPRPGAAGASSDGNDDPRIDALIARLEELARRAESSP